MTRQHTAWVAVLTLALAGSASAQEQATVLKRDGTRVSGRFEAWNRNTNTLYIRVSLGDQRIIPLGQAAVVDVEGNGQNLPETELGPARGGDHVLVLRTGDVIRGRLTNIEGGEGSGQDNEPRMLTFKPNDAGERRVRFSDVRRLYLGNFPASLTTAPAPPQPAVTEPDVPTGAIRVPGNGRLGRHQRRWCGAPTASRSRPPGRCSSRPTPRTAPAPAGSLKGRYAANAPAPTLLAGALIGRVGTGPPFPIGDQTQPLPMPADGPLFLTVNDDEVSDNQGAFAVTLRVIRGRR